jgi:hypothetical protein
LIVAKTGQSFSLNLLQHWQILGQDDPQPPSVTLPLKVPQMKEIFLEREGPLAGLVTQLLFAPSLQQGTQLARGIFEDFNELSKSIFLHCLAPPEMH